MPDADLPWVAVFHDGGSLPVFDLMGAAAEVCRIIWVTGWGADSVPVLRRFGRHLEVGGQDAGAIARALREIDVAGVVTFSDPGIELAADVAALLGLPYHSPLTARRLRDKHLQRTVLGESGLDVPRSRLLRAGDIRCPADLAPLEPSWPAVLKPRRGMGSVDTFLVRDASETLTTLAQMDAEKEFVLEDFVGDRPDPGSRWAADVISVELLVLDGHCEPIALTGRFRFDPPFRESGSFLPADVSGETRDSVIAQAGEAARALGVRTGILHVELKLSPEGPRIIEVNGRVGGLVPELLARVGGPPILTMALELALGRRPRMATADRAGGQVAFYRAWLPPTGAHRLRSVVGLAELSSWEEIDRAWLGLQMGESIDSRVGGGVVGYIAAAFGAVTTLDDLPGLMDDLQAALRIELDPITT